jgi:hypothetical protein
MHGHTQSLSIGPNGKKYHHEMDTAQMWGVQIHQHT